MKQTLSPNERLESLIMGFIADGFNRSMNSLEKAGAINLDKLREKYQGVGAEYYDIVTKEMELTAKCAAPVFKNWAIEFIKTFDKTT